MSGNAHRAPSDQRSLGARRWHDADAEFLAHARADIDTLLTEVDRLRADAAEKEQALLRSLFHDMLDTPIDGSTSAQPQPQPSAWRDHDHTAEAAFLHYVDDPTPAKAHAAELAIALLQRRYDHVLNRIDGGTGDPAPFPVHRHNAADHPQDCLGAVLHELAGARLEDRSATSPTDSKRSTPSRSSSRPPSTSADGCTSISTLAPASLSETCRSGHGS